MIQEKVIEKRSLARLLEICMTILLPLYSYYIYLLIVCLLVCH